MNLINVSKAVGVALMVKDRLVSDHQVERMVINTEQLVGDDGQPMIVSSIAISLHGTRPSRS